jgi:hypothetical protein
MSRTIILASTGNGIVRAEGNGTVEWSVAATLPGKDVRCLAANPLDQRIIYAGTQDQGVLRSQDCGETWSELTGFQRIPGRWWWFSPAEPPYQAYVQSIAISPENPLVLLAGIEFGAVIRSQDGGRTWSPHRRGALRDNHWLTFHGKNGNWAYQAGGTGGGASFSQDGGQTWRKARQGLAKNYGVACAADAQKPEVWYVSVAPGPGKAYGAQAEAYLYRASGGAAWQPIGWQEHPLSSMPISLVTHSRISGKIFAGLTNGQVWHSSDYGDTWQQLPVKFSRIQRSMLVLDIEQEGY